MLNKFFYFMGCMIDKISVEAFMFTALCEHNK